ncbi:MAG: hypothetical protein HUJ26_11295 [Planctomycetaceae bacterium]|nr:hypothetical protein [Planctomycetaceae bacterium]
MNRPTSEKVKRLVASFPGIHHLHFEMPSDADGEWERIIDAVASLKELKGIRAGIRINDNTARPLSQLKNLEELSISVESLSAEGAASLKQMESVTRLTLYPQGEQADLLGQRVLNCFPKLRHLIIDGPGVSTKTFQAIGELKELKSLRGGGLNDVHPENFGFVSRLTNLEELTYSMKKEKGYLQHLSPLKKLKRLDISYQLKDDGEFDHLEELTNLEHIRIGGALSDKALYSFRNMTKLKSLLLYSDEITGSGLRHLKNLDELQKLRLYRASLAPEHVPHLLELERLEYLDVAWSTLQNENHWKSLKQLKPLKHLKQIWIELEPKQWEELEAALPGVSVYYYE